MASDPRDYLIFPDQYGFWNTIAKDEKEQEPSGRSFYESLVPTMKPSENAKATWDPNSEAALRRMVDTQAKIDTLTHQMQANVDVSGAAGEDALKRLLADPSQEPEVRAAASQTLYPGMRATIGQHGELSFSAAPGSDLGFNYPDKVQQNNPTAAAKAAPALEKLDGMFARIESLTDPDEIMTAYSEIQLAAAQFSAARKAQYSGQFGKALGVDTFDAALSQSRAMDRQAALQYFGTADVGDSKQTQQLIGTQAQIRSLLDKRVEEQLQSDPDAVGIASRMRWLDTLVQNRLGSLDQVTARSLVPIATIDAVAEGMGWVPAELTDKQRIEIADRVTQGDKQYLAAAQISQASLPELLGIASAAGGQTSIWAAEALDRRFDTPEFGKQLVTAVKNFDSLYLSKMTQEEASQFELSSAQRLLTGKALEQAQSELQTKRINHVLNAVASDRTKAFENSVDRWDVPQTADLSTEWKVALDTLKASKGAGEPIAVQEIVESLNWDIPVLEAQRKIKLLSEYIASQAGRVGDSKALGPVQLYSDPAQAEGFVNTTVVGMRWRDLRAKATRAFNAVSSAIPGLYMWPTLAKQYETELKQAARSAYGSTVGLAVEPVRETLLLDPLIPAPQPKK